MEPANYTLIRVNQESLQVPNIYSGIIDGRILSEVIKMVSISSKNVQALENECAVLKTRNKMLELEITQLKTVHAVELNATVDSCIAIRDLIVEKLIGIVERLTVFSANYNFCGSTPIDVSSFRTLNDEVSKFNYDGVKIYPEHSSRPLKKLMPIERAVIVLTSGTILPAEAQSEIEKIMEETKILEGNVESLRAESQALMAQKEAMLDFHKHHLEDLNKREKQGRIKQAIQKVRAIYDSIKWEIPKTNGAECANCIGEFAGMAIKPSDCARFAQIPHEKNQIRINEKLTDVRDLVLNAVKSLEALIL